MKLFKRIFSYLIAFTMVLSLATLAGVNVHAASATQNGLSITINSKTQGHTFEAYQLFSGKVDTNEENSPANTNNKVLSDIDWGTGITDTTVFVQKLSEDSKLTTTTSDNKTTYDFAGVKTENGKPVASSVAEKLQAIKENAAKVEEFAKVAGKYLSSPKNSTSGSTQNGNTYTYTITGLDAGYYLVKDKDSAISGDENGVTDKAYTAYILNVVGNTNVNEKSDIPTVEKEVEQFEDNNATSGTFKKNADHEIGKKFKFRLTASIPADVNVANYDSYELKFNDTMSAGISFDEINSVVLSDGTTDSDHKLKEVKVPVKTDNTNGYETAASSKTLANGGDWSLTIADIKKYDTLDFSKAITATVIYTAHLNENAFVNTSTGETETKNKNEVDLQYSNNPNASGLGKTSKKDVYVFAYGIDSTKKANSAEGNSLSGAKFTIRRNNKGGEALKFKLVTTDKETYYLLTTDAESKENNVSTTVTSGSDGKFNIRGLDEGTYYFEETEAPAGYNTVDPFTVKITPTLGTGADISKASYKEYSNYDANAEKHPEYNNIVVDKSGSTLPSTGGMGTTLLYVAGGILVACAVAYVVLNKKHAK